MIFPFSRFSLPSIRPSHLILVVSGCALLFSSACVSVNTEEKVGPMPRSQVSSEVRISGAAEIVESVTDPLLLQLTESEGRSVVTFNFSKESLDVSAFQELMVRVYNETDSDLDIFVTGLSSLQNTWANRAQSRHIVRPGTEGFDVSAFMYRRPLPREHPLIQKFGSADGLPGGHHRHWETVNPENIVRVTVRIDWEGATPGQTFRLSQPFGAIPYSADPAIIDTLDFPILDRFGQMRGMVWETKLLAESEFHTDAAGDLAMAEKIKDFGSWRSRFGGDLNGPQHEATGFFRVEIIDDRWWFIDPEGYLFWSIGANSVARGGETIVTGRESLFPEGLTGRVNFHEKNLALKYGEGNWEAKHVDVTIARMKDWGMNTVGAWSRPALFEAKRVPYTIQIHTDKEGVGSIGKMPDPFDTRFRNSLEQTLIRLSETHSESPWLLGIFIHNELNWGGGIRLGEEILRSGPNRPARRAALVLLQERYPDIEALNKAWGADFNDFNEINALEAPNDHYRSDVEAIMDKFASRYFEICRDMMRKYFPNHLYLGGRFHNFNPIITRAASRYQDVISLNIYQFRIADFSIQTEVDRPFLIGEFHFGIGDHGHWGRGLRAASDARNQADLMRLYLGEALNHRQMVGAHWFAWADQPATGRGSDGENFGIGLVSVVDRPHRLLVDTLREVSKKMYEIRSGR